MNFAGHATGAGIAAAVVAAVCFYLGFPIINSLIAAGVFWFGGQFPDLDVASIPGRWFGRIGFVLATILLSLGTLGSNIKFLVCSSIIGLFALVLQAMNHRGPTHKYWLPIFLLFFAYFGTFQSEFYPVLIRCFACGVIAHLFIDRIFPWNLKGWII